METAGIDWSKLDVGKVVEGLNKEEKAEKLGQIAMIMELQGKINELKITWEIVKGQKEAEVMRQKEREREQRVRQKEREEDDDRLNKESYERNEREREEREEQRRLDEECRNIEMMRIKEERRAEKKWRRQERQERRREENRQRAMEERKCFVCKGFEHMAYSCRNVGEEGPALVSLNKFEVLKDRVM